MNDVAGELTKLVRLLDPQAVIVVAVLTSVVKTWLRWGRRNARLVALLLGMTVGALLCAIDPLDPTKILPVSWQFMVLKGFYSAAAAILGYELVEPFLPWKKESREGDTR